MFKHRGLKQVKATFQCKVLDLTGCREDNRLLWLQWKRGSRSGTTKKAYSSSGSASWQEMINVSCTLFLDEEGLKFEPKSLSLTLHQDKDNRKGKETVGKCSIDLAEYALVTRPTQVSCTVDADGGFVLELRLCLEPVFSDAKLQTELQERNRGRSKPSSPISSSSRRRAKTLDAKTASPSTTGVSSGSSSTISGGQGPTSSPIRASLAVQPTSSLHAQLRDQISQHDTESSTTTTTTTTSHSPSAELLDSDDVSADISRVSAISNDAMDNDVDVETSFSPGADDGTSGPGSSDVTSAKNKTHSATTATDGQEPAEQTYQSINLSQISVGTNLSDVSNSMSTVVGHDDRSVSAIGMFSPPPGSAPGLRSLGKQQSFTSMFSAEKSTKKQSRSTARQPQGAQDEYSMLMSPSITTSAAPPADTTQGNAMAQTNRALFASPQHGAARNTKTRRRSSTVGARPPVVPFNRMDSTRSAMHTSTPVQRRNGGGGAKLEPKDSDSPGSYAQMFADTLDDTSGAEAGSARLSSPLRINDQRGGTEDNLHGDDVGGDGADDDDDPYRHSRSVDNLSIALRTSSSTGSTHGKENQRKGLLEQHLNSIGERMNSTDSAGTMSREEQAITVLNTLFETHWHTWRDLSSSILLDRTGDAGVDDTQNSAEEDDAGGQMEDFMSACVLYKCIVKWDTLHVGEKYGAPFLQEVVACFQNQFERAQSTDEELFWLENLCVLQHLVHSQVRKYNLAESYVQEFEDACLDCMHQHFKSTVQTICDDLEPSLVSAFLKRPSPMALADDSSSAAASAEASTRALAKVKATLGSHWTSLLRDGRNINSAVNMVTDVPVRIMSHVFRFIGVFLFDQLLRNSTLCTFSNGLAIKMAINSLEDWVEQEASRQTSTTAVVDDSTSPGSSGSSGSSGGDIHTAHVDVQAMHVDVSTGSISSHPFPIRRWSRQLVHIRQAADILSIPKQELVDDAVRAEVCPDLSVAHIHQLLVKFQPDEFEPSSVPNAVLSQFADLVDSQGELSHVQKRQYDPRYVEPFAKFHSRLDLLDWEVLIQAIPDSLQSIVL